MSPLGDKVPQGTKGEIVLNQQSSKVFNCSRNVSNYQIYEVFDDTAAQVILAIENGDSIRRVAQHLHTPYETVRQAVNRLENAGYISYDDGLSVVDERVRDAVYVWTQGGYQVGRDRDDYPLFLAVHEQDVDTWKTFFESFDLPTAFER